MYSLSWQLCFWIIIMMWLRGVGNALRVDVLVGFHTVSLLILETPYQLLTWLLEDITFFTESFWTLFCFVIVLLGLGTVWQSKYNWWLFGVPRHCCILFGCPNAFINLSWCHCQLGMERAHATVATNASFFAFTRWANLVLQSS